MGSTKETSEYVIQRLHHRSKVWVDYPLLSLGLNADQIKKSVKQLNENLGGRIYRAVERITTIKEREL